MLKLRSLCRMNALKASNFKTQFKFPSPSLTPHFSFCETVIDKARIISDPKLFRNIAIIAHVDHGKTTLVDALLAQSGCVVANERAMDSNELEQEKGITILSKCTSVLYKDYKINIVDTPGHQDFGGEVERIMNMVEGVCLVICSTEGPMTQSKFVLSKALKQNLKPIVIINKVDRPSTRIEEVETEIFDLFCSLDAPDHFLDYPIIYASARSGWAVRNMADEKKDVTCILDAIIEHIDPPKVDQFAPFSMLISQTESHPFFGKILIGRVNSGFVKTNDKIAVVNSLGAVIENGKVFKMLRRFGMVQVELEECYAGDLVQIAGLSNANVTDTLNAPGNTISIPSLPIDPPMISLNVYVNTSPLAGIDGDKVTFSQLRDRILKEAENDVALKVISPKTDSTKIEMQGRGDLHLSLILEKMRREGYEFAITPPQIMFRMEKGSKLEPIESFSAVVDLSYVSTLIEKMNLRCAEYIGCVNADDDKQKLTFTVPTRGMIGLRSEIVNETRGQAIMESYILGYEPYRGVLKRQQKAPLVANHDGMCTSYGINNCEKLGNMFVKPGQKVYAGMVVGEAQNEQEIETNPAKEKRFTNVRAAGVDEAIKLSPPRIFEINEALAYIRDDEIVEITPKNLRMRKKELNPSIRKVLKRQNKSSEAEYN